MREEPDRSIASERLRILTLLHQEEYRLGALEMVAHGRVELDVIDTTRERIPDDVTAAGAQGLISLGGDMGATEEDRFAFLRREIALLRSAHGVGIPILGICLGGQMLARALGGSVVPSGAREVGVLSVDFVEPDDVLGVPGRRRCFLWHRDRFEPPPGARVLARTERCTQAFRVGRSLGVQFHPETTTDSVRQLLQGSSAEVLSLTSAERAAVEREVDGRTLPSGRTMLDSFLRLVVDAGSAPADSIVSRGSRSWPAEPRP
jgi:GMP synthase-like glutamine amidotransferase